jgi:hypothetical protein
MQSLSGITVVNLSLNLPGPAAARRLLRLNHISENALKRPLAVIMAKLLRGETRRNGKAGHNSTTSPSSPSGRRESENSRGGH